MTEDEALQVAEAFLSAQQYTYSRCYARGHKRNYIIPYCDYQQRSLFTEARKLVWYFCYIRRETPPNVIEDKMTFYVFVDDESGQPSYVVGP